VMDYPCAKVGDFGLNRFGIVVRTDGHTDRITEWCEWSLYWHDYRWHQ